jgi:hypothetical protein
MKDSLQRFAHEFCLKFGFSEVEVAFAEEFTKEDVKLYNFLMAPPNISEQVFQSPAGKLLALRMAFLPKEAEEARIEAKKDFLWRKLLSNPKQRGYTAMIELESARVLKAAVDICERRNPQPLHPDEHERALIIARKISQYHLEGRAIQMFRDLAEKVNRNIPFNNVPKMPLFELDKNDLLAYEHEVIHYILYMNRCFTDSNPFDEGLTTFLHIRKSGAAATRGMYNPIFGGRGDYNQWSQFFFKIFANVQDGQIGRNLMSEASGFGLKHLLNLFNQAGNIKREVKAEAGNITKIINSLKKVKSFEAQAEDASKKGNYLMHEKLRKAVCDLLSQAEQCATNASAEAADLARKFPNQIAIADRDYANKIRQDIANIRNLAAKRDTMHPQKQYQMDEQIKKAMDLILAEEFKLLQFENKIRRSFGA